MRYSLLSQFQGAFLGAAFGDLLGVRCQWGPPPTDELRQRWAQPQKRASLAALNCKLRLEPEPAGGVQLAIACAQSLIGCNGFNLQDWQEAREAWAKPEASRNEDENLWALLKNPERESAATVALATLPAVLFFHEDAAKQRQTLQQVTEIWQHPPLLSAGPMAVGGAIAQALRHQLDPAALIPNIITYLQGDTPLTAQLLQVQVMLEQAASLEATLTHLCNKKTLSTQNPVLPPTDKLHQQGASYLPIALAFYCFLSTPEDLGLAVVRAARTGIEPRLTCALTGALSGAYNSSAALPPGWERALAGNLRLGATPQEAQIKDLAANLLAVWSGVGGRRSRESPLTWMVAAPRVMRPHQFESGER